MIDTVQSHEKFTAANEIRKFRRMFKAVFALGERLEAEASMEQSIEERERRLSALKEKEEGVLAELQGKIAVAEEKLSHLNSQAIADHETRVLSLKGEKADILSGIEAEISAAKGKAAAAAEDLRNTEELLRKREEELFTVETRLRQLREKINS